MAQGFRARMNNFHSVLIEVLNTAHMNIQGLLRFPLGASGLGRPAVPPQHFTSKHYPHDTPHQLSLGDFALTLGSCCGALGLQIFLKLHLPKKSWPNTLDPSDLPKVLHH